jgi:hypothetical protein
MGVVHETADELVRDLLPSREVVWNGNRFSTNSHGMRDREYPLQKPEGTLRIAMLGPSHVMGSGVADDETFENVLEARYQAEGQPIEVLNFSVDGYSLPQEVAMFERRALAFKPDIALLTIFHPATTMTEQYLLRTVYGRITSADAHTRKLLEQGGLANVDLGRIPVPYPALRNLVRKLGLQPRMPQGEAEWRVRRVAEAVTARSIEQFAEHARSAGVLPVVLVLNAVVDGGPRDVPYLAQLESARLPVIDLSHIYPEDRLAEMRVAPWDDHPNAIAHRLIADEIHLKLAPMLQELHRVGATTASTH